MHILDFRECVLFAHHIEYNRLDVGWMSFFGFWGTSRGRLELHESVFALGVF